MNLDPPAREITEENKASSGEVATLELRETLLITPVLPQRRVSI
jgi:hypothetical protein